MAIARKRLDGSSTRRRAVRGWKGWRTRVVGVAGAVCLAAILVLAFVSNRQEVPDRLQADNNALKLADVLRLSPHELETLDIAQVNLVCAGGLPGAEGLDPQSCLRTLDLWAAKVRDETERHLYRFRRNPAEYYGSEAYFRMLMMAVVLYEDCGVRYNPARISDPGQRADLSFFGDSRDIFIHGMLAGRQPGGMAVHDAAAGSVLRLGTCSSMPVLYAAIGRRLGYPLKLVTTKAHLFLRWESSSERFNLEATGKGMNRYDDEHFKRWPYPVSEQEIRADGYLRSLAPAEEVAVFMSLRAHCLQAAGRLPEAVQALEHAVRLAPESRPYRLLLAALREGAGREARLAAPALPPEYEVLPGRRPGSGMNPNRVWRSRDGE